MNDAIASFVGAKNVSRSSRALSASRTAGTSRVASESRLREGCVSTISIRVEHSFSFPGGFSSPGQGQVSQSSKYASASGAGAPTGPQAAGTCAGLVACIKRRVSRRSRPRYRFERLIVPEYLDLLDLARLSENPPATLEPSRFEASPMYCARRGSARRRRCSAQTKSARGANRENIARRGRRRALCVWTGVGARVSSSPPKYRVGSWKRLSERIVVRTTSTSRINSQKNDTA